MKRLSALLPALVTLLCLTVSCSETKETDDHANWKSRNKEFISDLAKGFSDMDSNTTSQGDRFRILSFKLDPTKEWGPDNYIYCEVLNKGAGSVSPQSTDSVRINYRVRLIPTDKYPDGQVMDQSFKTQNLDPTVNVPSEFKLSSLIKGVVTAAIHMHSGDYWRVYIPYDLGYGSKDQGTIPGYSTLIYDLNLIDFSHIGTNLPD